MTTHYQGDFMAKQENVSTEKAKKSAENDSSKKSDMDKNSGLPNENLDTESEFAVNELRDEKHESQ
jgi:hypothetical protein